MAKNLSFSFNGKDCVFAVESIDRSDLYGKRRRIQLDTKGNPCSRVSVTLDGSITLRPGMTGQGYFLPDGAYVKQAQLETYDINGKLLDKKPSSFSEVQKLEGPVPPEEILDTRISSVYSLDAVDLSDDLKAALDGGDIYTFLFNFRDSYLPEKAFLMSNKNGYFILSGSPAESSWVTLQTVAVMPVLDDEDSDDLDFEML